MGRERTGREYGTRRDWHWSAVLPLNYFPSLRTLQIDYKNPLCICDYKLLHLCSEHCRELFRFISFFRSAADRDTVYCAVVRVLQYGYVEYTVYIIDYRIRYCGAARFAVQCSPLVSLRFFSLPIYCARTIPTDSNIIKIIELINMFSYSYIRCVLKTFSHQNRRLCTLGAL